MRGFYCITIFSVLLLSCSYHVQKATGSGPAASAISGDTALGATLVQQSVLGVCLRCHSGTTAPDLSSLDSLRAHINQVQGEVNGNQMPPPSAGYSPLGDCQKAILREWVNQGMPSESTTKVADLPECGQGGLATPPPTLPILQMPLNYQTLNSQILQPRCLHCHNANSGDPDASEILLFPYSALTAHRWLGVDSAHSKLLKIVARTDDERMPPPQDGPALTPDQIEFIRRWLDAGHPEN